MDWITLSLVTGFWVALGEGTPAGPQEEVFVPLPYVGYRGPMERVLRSHDLMRRQQLPAMYRPENTRSETHRSLKDVMGNAPLKTTTTHTKFSTNENQNVFSEAVPEQKVENDPAWWSEYPIPFVGTTSNSDTKWNGGSKGFHSSEFNEGKDYERTPVGDLRIENKRQISERSPSTADDDESFTDTVEKPFGSNEGEKGSKYIEPEFGPLALPMKQRLMSPPLKRIQNIVHLSSVDDTNDQEEHESSKQNSNPIFGSLWEMISTAENLGRKQHENQSTDSELEKSADDQALGLLVLGSEREKQSSRAGSTVVDIKEKEGWEENLIDWDPAKTPLTTAVLGSVMLFIILVVVVLALRVHCRNRQKLSQEWIRHPIVQPHTAASGGIQPHIPVQTNHQLTQAEPIRIKAKGLLERRGSNTSLTIDLPAHCRCPGNEESPTRECTPEEFLMSAGNRMNRKQLRQCLYDPRILHTEFWQIPSNHPEKCLVPGSADKNRYRTVLPNDDSRVILTTPEGEERYINANYIRGYDCDDKSFIATQGPLANTVEDLWLMVLQEKSPAIVMITRLKEKGRVKCEAYVPSYSATYDGLQVTVKQVVQKNGYTIRQIQIQRGDVSHTTLHFWFTSWPDHKTPSSARHLLNMATEVNETQKAGGSVVVHCSAGIGRTGCFIAISNCIQQLFEEDCADILATVCQMRLDRGGMVQTPEQYEFIHRALALYESTLPLSTVD